MVTWSSSDYDKQKTDIARALQQLTFLEKKSFAVTLHSATAPTSAQLFSYWVATTGLSPVLGAKMQWWDTSIAKIGATYVYTAGELVANFLPIVPITASNWELIDSLYLKHGVASSDFNITVPPTFQDLYIQFTGGKIDAGVSGTLEIRINGNTGVNYIQQYQGGQHNSYLSALTTKATRFLVKNVPFVSADDYAAASLVMHIPFYSLDDGREKVVYFKTGMSATSAGTPKEGILFGAGAWEVDAVISEINFLDGTGFTPGTRLSVWGVNPV